MKFISSWGFVVGVGVEGSQRISTPLPRWFYLPFLTELHPGPHTPRPTMGRRHGEVRPTTKRGSTIVWTESGPPLELRDLVVRATCGTGPETETDPTFSPGPLSFRDPPLELSPGPRVVVSDTPRREGRRGPKLGDTTRSQNHEIGGPLGRWEPHIHLWRPPLPLESPDRMTLGESSGPPFRALDFCAKIR